MTVLIEWFTTPGNYASWRGSKISLVASKKVLLGRIVTQLREVGITNRKEQNICGNISALQNDFSKVADWLSSTGNGVRAEKTNAGTDPKDTERYIRDVVKKIYKYYYDLEPYFGDRPSTEEGGP
ncbi:hypothetical protein DFQ28_003996 [Apophysomyces sp. BC1034]|nr:hypothetical protein DFQ28_003996 [Apophysomyces sp. BC1034]